MPNTATDDHRFLITAPWGDQAYGDTIEEARAARTQLAQDARDSGLVPGARYEDVTVLDRGFAPPDCTDAVIAADGVQA